MGVSIDLYSYDYEALLEGIQSYTKAENTEVIRKILLIGGNVVGDKYIILNNELWEDNSSYYNVPNALERLYKVDDVFGKIFCTFDELKTSILKRLGNVDSVNRINRDKVKVKQIITNSTSIKEMTEKINFETELRLDVREV